MCCTAVFCSDDNSSSDDNKCYAVMENYLIIRGRGVLFSCAVIIPYFWHIKYWKFNPKKIISGTLNESQNPDSVGGGCNLNFSSGWHRVFHDNEAEIARRWCGQFNTAWRKILSGSLSWLRSGWWISLMWAIQCWVLLCVWNIVSFPELTWVGLMNLTEVKYNTDSATMPRKGEKLVALHCTCNVDN